MGLRLPILLMSLAGACAAPIGSPSLAPRPAEAIDPRIPIETPAAPGTADAALAERLNALLGQARAGHRAFGAAADAAEQLAGTAGPAGSESWVAAHQALSHATAVRAPTPGAMADIDEMAARLVAERGWIAPADQAAIQQAGSEVAAMDRSQAARIERIEARLRR